VDIMRSATLAVAASTAVLLSNVGIAADYPAAKEGDWIARDFKFHTGEIMPEVLLHY
jgi:homoserine O-acetyltransferase/O-succinyltransferase